MPAFSDVELARLLAPLEVLRGCVECPHECKADRASAKLGVCKSGMGFSVGSICAHRGEEPVISGPDGICNVFFTRCNMQCVYCQNWQISRTNADVGEAAREVTDIICQIEKLLESGCQAVGFVSPSHYIPHVRVIINALKARGHDPIFVYNTSGYDKAEIIRSFEDSIHVYLPDLKYMDNRLAKADSDTRDYVEHATAAVREMFRQKGANIYCDDRGRIQFGMVIRHLVLPGQAENSKAILRWIAEELSPNVHLSLMSQYHPTPAVAAHPELGRTLRAEEYQEVLEEFRRLGFHRGWIQELSSPQAYRPDFTYDHPLER